MVVLGLLLVLLAALVALGVLVPGARDALGDAGAGSQLTDPNAETAFLLGVLASALALLGLLLLTAGARRRATRRKAQRQKAAAARTEAEALAEENARLQERLQQEQSRTVSPYGAGEQAPGGQLPDADDDRSQPPAHPADHGGIGRHADRGPH